MRDLWASPWTWGAAATVVVASGVGVALGASSGRKKYSTEDFGRTDGEGDAQPFELPEDAKGRDLVPRLCAQAGLPDDVATFLNFVALGEAGWNPLVALGDPSLVPDGIKVRVDMDEAAGARRAYERRAEIFADCPHSPQDYQFGSGGLFGALPAYWLYHFRTTPLRCASPFEVFDAAFAIAGAYSFARGVSLHPAFEGNVRSLRAGWGSLKRMVDRSYDGKLAKWRRQARTLGLPESYIDGPAPEFPKLDLLELYHRLGGELARSGKAVA